MKKIFSILFALVLVVSLGLATAAPVLADFSPGWTDITQVAAGDYHTVGLKSDGTVVAVGINEYEQCDVGGWTGITQVAAAVYHTVGLESDGTVVAVGRHSEGQCDVGGWTGITQVAAGGAHTVGLKSDGTVVAVGNNYSGQCDVGGWTGITQVAAGAGHTVGLKDNGTVVAVGDNLDEQCDVEGFTGIDQLAAGRYHTVGLESDGTVIAVGANYNGQCDVGNWTDIDKVAIGGGLHTVGLKADGTVVAVGRNDYGQCDVEDWTDIDQVATGGYHTVGLKADGTVVAVGNNYYGQCGEIVTETVTDGTVDAKDEADTEVEVDGTATVTVAPYDENPGDDAPTDFNALDKYIDVYVPDTTEVTEIEIRLYYTDAELAAAGVDEESLWLLWWNDTAWVQCSDSGVNTTSTNGYSGYMWAKIRNNTTPSLDDMQGTPFGGYEGPSEPPQQGCFIATAAYGTDTAKEIDILREFRDEYLLTNPLGQALVDLYYRVSPPMAQFITEHPSLKPIVRAGLVPAVAMSAVAVNTTPAEKAAIVGLLVLVSVALAIWATKRRGRGSDYT